MEGICEFADFFEALPKPGLSSIDAERFLRERFPDVERWTSWHPTNQQSLCGVCHIPAAEQDDGHFGDWSWEVIATDYPRIKYHARIPGRQHAMGAWSGAIRVTGARGGSFIVFSYLSATGKIGETFFTSCPDTSLLDQLAEDAVRAFHPMPNALRIHVVNGEDINLDPEEGEDLTLHPETLKDMESQVDVFFGRADCFKAFRLPPRRGFLFVGPPGNGKTMVTRHLLRRCWEKFGTRATALMPSKHVDESMVAQAFMAAAGQGKGILILDELDSLIKECDLTRASFLAMLDGLRPKESVLMLASTNNPAEIDPALVHRPSRFDRVWHFRNPDGELRQRFLAKVFPHLDADVLTRAATRTQGWSFAYMNELRATAAVLCIRDQAPGITQEHLEGALDLLVDQFKSGRKNHVETAEEGSVGFMMA